MRAFEYADRIEYIKLPQPIPAADDARVRDTVARIMADVAARGDAALRDYSKQFDGVEVEQLLQRVGAYVPGGRTRCSHRR